MTADKPIRVLHALRAMERAGIETWLMHLLRRFDRREIAMDFLVQTEQPAAYDEEIRSLGAGILRCPQPQRPWRYASNFRRVLACHEAYDIVHSHNYWFSGFDLRLAFERGVPARIAHIHPYSDLKEGQPLRAIYRRWMTAWIQRYATAIFSPSYASLESFAKFADIRGRYQAIVRNCIDPALFDTPLDREAARRELGLPADVPVVVYVARFAPHKNHNLIVRVANRFRDAGIAAHFALAGSPGDALPALLQAVSGRTDFSVFQNPPDVTRLLRASDLFLFPSLEEGFGTVAIEAAAAGLPVVATDLPAIREACAPSHREFAFERDADAGAYESVSRILGRPELRRRLSQDAAQWARDFSIESVSREMRKVYYAIRNGGAALEAVS